MTASPAPAAMPGEEEIAKLISGAPFPSTKSLTKARAILALFDPILAEKENLVCNLDAIQSDHADTLAMLIEANAERREFKARALAAEAALAAERVNAVDGSINIRLDDKGGIDEIFGNGVLCHIERMDKGHWFVNMVRPDQSSEAFWLNGRGKVEFTLHEHRKAPTTGPNVEPWTVAAAIRAQRGK